MTAPRASALVLCAMLASVLPIGTAAADPSDPGENNPVTTREIGRDRLFAVFDSHYGEIKARPEAMRQRLTADRRAMEKEGHVFLKASKGNAFLNDLVSQCLTKVGPRPNLPFQVNMVASWDKEGKPAKAILANRSGLILISVATLQSVKHVDEIAFLLAHEYGHVAMQHPRSPQEYEKMLDDDASDGAKLSAQAIAALAGEGIGKNMLLRRHEDHADFYGFDAMRACSYNHTAANQVLQSIGDWDLEKGIFERQKELEGEMSSKENVEKGGLGSIFTGLGKAFALGAEAITHGETKDTRPSADRRQLLNFYDQEYYGGAVKFDFPAFRSRNAKWTAYKETSEWRSLVSKYGASSGR